jgi:hypothetical protein
MQNGEAQAIQGDLPNQVKGLFAKLTSTPICGRETNGHTRSLGGVFLPSENLFSCLIGVEMTEESPSKHCPICSQQLPLSEFGVCRARKDGRNLYCKSCIRKKVTDSRRALKEYRSARKRYVSQPLSQNGTDLESNSNYSRALSKLSPVERVREAIRKGARTQKEIANQTRLGKDEIGEAIANLLLWTREIKTEVVDNTRHYSLNESAEALLMREENLDVPRRKRDVPSSFSAIQGLMPGRNAEDEPVKIGGWVAA